MKKYYLIFFAYFGLLFFGTADVYADEAKQSLAADTDARLIELMEKYDELNKVFKSTKLELDRALATINNYEKQLQTLTNLVAEQSHQIKKLENENTQQRNLEQRLNNSLKILENKTNENLQLLERYKIIEAENLKLNNENLKLKKDLQNNQEILRLKTIEVNSAIKDKYELLEENEKLKMSLSLLEKEKKEKITELQNNLNEKSEKIKIEKIEQLTNLANSAVLENNFSEALKYYEEINDLTNDSDVIKYNIAALLYQLADLAKAEKYIDAALNLNPENLLNKILKLQILV
ncbi:MAG TPA: hypothetical protein PLJ38_02400, partial [bacterium]|nr:hypothetical protein [bacterium]